MNPALRTLRKKRLHRSTPAWCWRIGGYVTLSATDVCPECGYHVVGLPQTYQFDPDVVRGLRRADHL